MAPRRPSREGAGNGDPKKSLKILKKGSQTAKIRQNGTKSIIFEHFGAPKRPQMNKNVSKIHLFEHFWSPWAPQNSSFSLYFQVGNPLFLRVGCVFRLKSHEILRKTRGFSLFETGETLYFTCPNAVFLVIFAADSKENVFFHPQSSAKTRVLG